MAASLPMPGRRRGRSGCSSALPYPPGRQDDCPRNGAERKWSSCLTSRERCVDVEVLHDQPLGTAEHTSDLVRRHLLLIAATHPIEHAEIVIDGRERVMRFAGDRVGTLA